MKNFGSGVIYHDASYLMNFTGNESYLPIGDLAYPAASFPDTKNILVALIKNDERFSYKIPSNKYNTISCFSGNYKIISNSFSCNECQVLGSFYISPSQSSSPYRNASENIAAVVNTFLYKIENENFSNLACDFNSSNNLYSKTPFYTYTVNNTNLQIANIDCYDLLPATCILELYTGDFSYGEIKIEDVKANAVSNIICNNNSSNFTDSLCLNYYKTSKDSQYNYDSRFFDFCSAKDTLGNFNYQNPYFKKICACYNPDEVYENYIKAIIEGLPESQRKQIESSVSQPPPCFYPVCSLESIEVVPRWNFKRGESCTDNAIQLCVSNVDIVNEGNITGNVSNNSMIDFFQQNISGGGGGDGGNGDGGNGGTTSPPGTKKSSKALWIVLGVFFVVLIILYFTVLKK
jgi:hypothetical protein